jgi:hypothetical protein
MRTQIINSILNNCNVRLQPSAVCDGVGVFAITDIPIGTTLFRDVHSDTEYIEFDEISNIPEVVLNYLISMCNSDETGIYLSRTVNNINITYFVNHSDTPNVEHDLIHDEYRVIRRIAAGEEILCVYNEKEKSF